MSDRVAVVGGGLAGAAAATALRGHGFTGPITVVCEEPDAPYDRTPLSKEQLFGDAPTTRLTLPVDADLILGDPVVRIDARSASIETRSGRRVQYGSLVLATGAVARTPPIVGVSLPGVHRLRTLADAEALRAELASGIDVVIVGAGLIGSEVASGLIDLGATVTVVDPDPAPLERALGSDVAAALRLRGAARGVRSIVGAVDQIEDVGGRAGGVSVAGERLRADLVILAVGAVPADGLARDAGLDVADGVICDAIGRTSSPAVYAAGDVARWACADGRIVRREHWRSALDQGAVVAATIAGRPASTPQPWMWTVQHGVRAEAAGEPARASRRVVDDTVPGELYVECLRGDALVGVAGIGCPRRVRKAMARLVLAEESASG